MEQIGGRSVVPDCQDTVAIRLTTLARWHELLGTAFDIYNVTKVADEIEECYNGMGLFNYEEEG